MGMPIITPGTGTKEQALTDIIVSIALQETALAHILNAEGEKMQAIICMQEVSTKELFELNCSVRKLLEAVTNLEEILKEKLEYAICGEKKCHKDDDYEESVPQYSR